MASQAASELANDIEKL